MKYPRFKVIISDKNGKVVHQYSSKHKTRFLYRLDLYFKRGFSVYIRCRYAKDPEGGYFDNEGIYYTKKDATHAYKCFTDPDLIKDFQ